MTLSQACSTDRRFGVRIDLEIFLNEYVRDRPFRALTQNLSETGLYLNRVHLPPGARPLPETRDVGLEFELPGTSEVIWARGRVCYESVEPYVRGAGIQFVAMPRVHARLLRDFCARQRRAELAGLLERIRSN